MRVTSDRALGVLLFTTGIATGVALFGLVVWSLRVAADVAAL